MLYLKKYLFFAILFFPFLLHAQDTCNLSFTGRILDADTDLPVTDINIELEKLHTTVKSDGHGFFKFDKLCAGTYFITVSGIGFERSSFEIQVIPWIFRLTNSEMIFSGIPQRPKPPSMNVIPSAMPSQAIWTFATVFLIMV